MGCVLSEQDYERLRLLRDHELQKKELYLLLVSEGKDLTYIKGQLSAYSRRFIKKL